MNKQLFVTFFFIGLFFTNFGIAGQNNIPSKGIGYACSNWEPMSYQDSKGNHSGLYIEILTEVFDKQLGIPLLTKISPWKRAQLEVKNGIADFMITVATQDRLEYSSKSDEPFFLFYLYVYTYKNHPLIKEINQIKTPEDILKLDLKTVTNLGNGWYKSNIEAMGVKTHYVRLEESALGFLSMKRADIMIDALVPTNHLVKKMDFASKIQLTKARFGPLKMHLLMSNKSPFLKLMPKINEAFKKSRKEGVIDEIISHYTSLKKPSQYNKKIFLGELK